MRKISGFTVIEIMVTVAVISILVATATMHLLTARENAMHAIAQGELKALYGAIVMYYNNNNQRYPPSLRDLRDYINISKFEDRFEINPSLNN